MDRYDYAPSWQREQLFLSADHEGIFDSTRDIPGWQHVNDSYKLYELAYYSGDVILEIGTFGGRSAVVELRGALAGAGGKPVQFYGCDISVKAIERTREHLSGAGLSDSALLYHGDVRMMLRDLPITPTMVFVDGDHSFEGVWSQLEVLTEHVCPGTPVLCHDYRSTSNGVSRAVREWIERGAYHPMGTFGCSVLLRAGEGCAGVRPRGLHNATFEALRDALYESALKRTVGRQFNPVAHLTQDARVELARDLDITVLARPSVATRN
jgi:hypothetical protein